VARGSHALLCIGSIPNSEGLGLEEVGVEMDGGYVKVDHHLRSSVPHIYVGGRPVGEAAAQSRSPRCRVARSPSTSWGCTSSDHRHLDYEKAASAIFTEPEIADVGLAEADAFAEGRKVRVTKVPFSASAKALINNDPRGFVKIVSDPATGVVLGGSIVGRHAAELISVIAVAVTAGLKVIDLAECILVHPALAEALTEAAE
jgi:pyruvate/2-oxoglutarate dehydrogenase complex dihydrolipoamide dehydrogenase (E3) component